MRYFAPLNIIYVEWVFWWVTWHVAALWQAKTVSRGFASGAGYILLAIAGFVMLLSLPGHYGWPPPVLWTLAPAAAWIAVGVGALGIVFMWWARISLGRLWSGGIARKEGHRIVDSGPYALVRHPIYTGLFVTALATVAVKGDALSLAGAILLVVAYSLKARLEERFLTAELGPAYEAYRRRVPMLVPFFPV